MLQVVTATAEAIINAGGGVDVIAGGLGNGTLTGCPGKGFFVFDTALDPLNNVDAIADLAVVDDTIRLENAALTATGTLAGSAFATGAATSTAHRILYDPATGVVRYDADGSGAGQPILFAKLGTALALTAADFTIV